MSSWSSGENFYTAKFDGWTASSGRSDVGVFERTLGSDARLVCICMLL